MTEGEGGDENKASVTFTRMRWRVEVSHLKAALAVLVLAVGPGGFEKQRPSGWRANSWESCSLMSPPLDFSNQIKI